MDFDEDRRQIRTADGPRIMASLRNLAVTILRRAGQPATPLPCATKLGGPADPFRRS